MKNQNMSVKFQKGGENNGRDRALVLFSNGEKRLIEPTGKLKWRFSDAIYH